MCSSIIRLFWNIIYYIKLGLSFLNLPAFIYDIVLTKPLTKYTYVKLYDQLIQHKGEKMRRILDVGTGTGYALETIITYISSETQVVGIDIDKNYVQAAQKRFENLNNVEIRNQNFYELENTKEKYDLIIFSSSFMLMPYRDKALQIAKSLLKKGGKIVFLMTLHQKKKKFIILEKIKPYIKYVTTIDFGSITYENDFDDLMVNNFLKVTHKERMDKKWNPLFKLFRIFYVETEPMANTVCE